MTAAFQSSLLDVGQGFGLSDLGGLTRTTLSRGAWVEVLPGWMSGADELFERLAEVVPWRAERRPMYDRVVDVPRLLSWYGKGQRLPDPALEQAMTELDARYRAQAGGPLCTAGLCLYRDGRDSVAWHGDNSGRRVRQTVVAIVSLGNPRALTLRPRPAQAGGGGSDGAGSSGSAGAPSSAGAAGHAGTLRFLLGHGDLLVMGGTCQRTWQHAIPKSTKAAGPRISVQFRPEGIH